MGSDDDVSEPGGRRIEIDARQVVDIPRGDIAQENMIDRGVAPLGREHPRLGQRREALADPPAPRRALGLRGHFISCLDMPVASEHAQHRLAADGSEIEEIIVIGDHAGEVVGHALRVAFGNDAQIKRHTLRGL